MYDMGDFFQLVWYIPLVLFEVWPLRAERQKEPRFQRGPVKQPRQARFGSITPPSKLPQVSGFDL